MTEQLWFVLSRGREFGPLTQAEVHALVNQNVIGPDAMVSVDRANWQMLQHAFGGAAQAQSVDADATWIWSGEYNLVQFSTEGDYDGKRLTATECDCMRIAVIFSNNRYNTL